MDEEYDDEVYDFGPEDDWGWTNSEDEPLPARPRESGISDYFAIVADRSGQRTVYWYSPTDGADCWMQPLIPAIRFPAGHKERGMWWAWLSDASPEFIRAANADLDRHNAVVEAVATANAPPDPIGARLLGFVMGGLQSWFAGLMLVAFVLPLIGIDLTGDEFPTWTWGFMFPGGVYSWVTGRLPSQMLLS